MLSADNCVLVVIDVQGKLARIAYKSEELFDNLRRLIKGIQALGVPILWTEQLPDKLGATHQEISELLPGLEPIIKNTFSCCGENRFMTELRRSNRKQVLLCGIECHVCVYQTAADLRDLGYGVHLVTDAVSCRSKGNWELGLGKMGSLGVQLTGVEMVLFELLRVAEGEKFKQIIKIVK
ncbi:hydrolase [bacterium]|nr:hydrolase [bacterium]